MCLYVTHQSNCITQDSGNDNHALSPIHPSTIGKLVMSWISAAHTHIHTHSTYSGQVRLDRDGTLAPQPLSWEGERDGHIYILLRTFSSPLEYLPPNLAYILTLRSPNPSILIPTIPQRLHLQSHAACARTRSHGKAQRWRAQGRRRWRGPWTRVG